MVEFEWELSLICISVVKHAIHQLVALFGKVVGVGRLVGRSLSLGSLGEGLRFMLEGIHWVAKDNSELLILLPPSPWDYSL